MIYDVVIIGAGPCGLAVAARLREPTPSALFTDAEHARYWHHFTKVQTLEAECRGKRQHQQRCRKGDVKSLPELDQHSGVRSRSILVLDAESDQWMHSWNSKFSKLQIAYLRSPLFFHCDPRDRDGLLEFSHFQGRANDVVDIVNVVGKEVSKHHKKCKKSNVVSNQRGISRHLKLDNRDQIDYKTPSSDLFKDHCTALVERYGLSDMVQNAKVTSIKYGPASIATEAADLFTLTTTTDQSILARTVVITGSGSNPSIPADHNFLRNGSANHLFNAGPILPVEVIGKIARREETVVAIVGGGLSSAQTAALLIHEHNVSGVHLLLRSRLKVKHFDVDLEWVSKLRNANMAAFWSADSDEERAEMLKSARGGGSIPPKWQKMLRLFEKAGRLQCWESSPIVSGDWDKQIKTWTLDVETTTLQTKSKPARMASHEHKLYKVDHVICATGSTTHIANIDFLTDVQREHPVDSINGLPRINKDLMWTKNLPLFVTGGLAGLRLGPGAGNLAGARLGAERIAWGIDEVLDHQSQARHRIDTTQYAENGRKRSTTDSGYESDTVSDADLSKPRLSASDRSEFTGGFNNQFEALAL